MNNVTMTTKGNTLVITVKLDGDRAASSSGKTDIVASTQGNAIVPGHPDLKVGVNVFATRSAS